MDADHDAIDPEQLLAHAGWVKGLARSLVFDQARVDDVVQETWMAALGRGPRAARDTRAWLGGILRNVVRQQARGERRRRQREEAAARPERDESGTDLVAKAEWLRTLVDAVLELREPYRSTVLAVDLDGESAADLARRLGVSAATVRSRRARALAMLRERLDASHGDRRAWSLALLPLALPTPAGAGAAPLLGRIVDGLGPTGTAKGVLIVSTKLKLTLGVVTIGAVLGGAWLVQEPPPGSSPTAGIEQLAPEGEPMDIAALPTPELPAAESERQSLVGSAPPADVPRVAGAHVLRLIIEGITDEDARLATVTLAGVDQSRDWRTEALGTWPSQGPTSEFVLDPYLALVEGRGDLRSDELEVEVGLPDYLSRATRVTVSRDGEPKDGETVHEATVTLVRPDYWPEFTLSVLDARTRAHLDDIELRFDPPSNAMWGVNETTTLLGEGLRSPILLKGGSDPVEQEPRLVALAHRSGQDPPSRLVERDWSGPGSGIRMVVRAPGHAWGSIALDVTKGDRELLLEPAVGLDVRLANVQLARYAELEVDPTLCIYWIREDGGNQYVRFEPLDETLRAEGFRLGNLLPGGYRVTVELGEGSWTKQPVLALEEVFLEAGETRQVVLSLADPPPPPDRATLGGVIAMPSFAGQDEVRLQLYHQPTQKWREPHVEFKLADLPRVGGALPTWSFRAEDMPIGMYRIQVLPFLEVLMVELPPDGREDVELVLPQLAEVLVETVDGRTGERVPVEEFYYKRPESLPGQRQNDWNPAEMLEPGRFQFWTMPGLMTIYPRNQGRLGYGAVWLDRELVPGRQTVRFELQPIYLMEIEFREGGSTLSSAHGIWDRAYYAGHDALRAVDHEGLPVNRGRSEGVVFVEVSAPGAYEITFGDITGDAYQPVPPRLIDVRAGEPTEVIVDLIRK
jgi:RNA polymerase sigma factor (sigma-70 family)